MLNRLKGVFKSFQQHDVRYVVIGGIAAVLYGVPRATFDLDILIEATPENAQRLLDALIDAGMGTATLTNSDEILIPDEEAPNITQGHYSEFLDRSWVAIDYIYQFLGCHPLLRKEKRLQDIYFKAERALSDLYQEAGKLEYESEQNRS